MHFKKYFYLKNVNNSIFGQNTGIIKNILIVLYYLVINMDLSYQSTMG